MNPVEQQRPGGGAPVGVGEPPPRNRLQQAEGRPEWALSRSRRAPAEQGEAWTAAAFLGPNVVGFLVFTLLPVGASVLLSFYDWDLFTTPRFTGFANHLAVWNSADFWHAVRNTLFLMMRIPVSVVLSLLLAMALNRGLKGTVALRTAYFLPSIVAGVPIYILWQWMYAPEVGVFNVALGRLGLGPVPWLTSVTMAKPSLMLMGLWAGVGGPNMVLYLAALQGINPELYEAARIDGAGHFQQWLRITVPMVSPTTFFILTMEIIGGFQGGFDAAYIMTQGGPDYSTTTVDYFVYQQAYEYSHLGLAATAAWFMFMMILAASVLFWRLGGKKVHYA